MTDRVHPESLQTLRQLAKLHGVAALRKALDTVARDMYRNAPNATGPSLRAQVYEAQGLNDPDAHLVGTPWNTWRCNVARLLDVAPWDVRRMPDAYESFNTGVSAAEYVRAAYRRDVRGDDVP
jgi:hypothetical protein